ncbi:MAG: NAD-dependent epimerase/dehydratase family protein, partial [Flavobacteriales bacterium]|nr:NAD-dependent epimerase/dehydratase family protein [Flavobacteriales bacterium]
MIVVTGAAGFIGSCLIAGLRDAGYGDLVAVDDFTDSTKLPNLAEKPLTEKVNRDMFSGWLDQ